MKTLHFMLFSVLLIPSLSRAGNEGGHGGGAIVCGNADGTIRSVELLDLHEKKGLDDGSTFTPNNTPESAQLEAALVKFASVAPQDVEKMRQVLKTLQTRPPKEGEQLVPPRDTGLRGMRRLPANCSLQGVADFDDGTGVLTLDPQFFDAMDSTNRVALKFHEALYKVWRARPVIAADSLKVRRVVGEVFADQPLGYIAPDAERANARYECDLGGLFDFLVLERADGHLEMQFIKFAGRPVIGKMTASVVWNRPLNDWYRSNLVGWLPENDTEGQIAVANWSARVRDGLRGGTTIAPKHATDPSQYAPLPFHYALALFVDSKYEPASNLVIWGGDYFIGGKPRRVSRNHHVYVHVQGAVSHEVPAAEISCHKP